MRGIRKTFPGVVALAGVDLTLGSGEVHMLLGENGAGKSTLMKILSGAYRKDSGEIRIRDQAVEITSPRHALELGIRVIYQELNLVPQLSVAENIFLGVAPTRLPGVIDRRKLTDLTTALLADLGMNLEAGTTAVQTQPGAAANGGNRQGASRSSTSLGTGLRLRSW
jgi:ribose transport system ATP-binding protein